MGRKKMAEKDKKKRKTAERGRCWIFTDYHDLKHEELFQKSMDYVRYVAYGNEVCPKTKRKHLQGWIQFNDTKNRRAVKNYFESSQINVRVMNGTPEENDIYCSKESPLVSFGKWVSQGARSDSETIHKRICDGATRKQIQDEFPGQYMRYHAGIDKMIAEATEVLRAEMRLVEVIVHSGITGSGKTISVMKKYPKVYKKEGKSLRWWTSYKGQKVLLIDEYNNNVEIDILLVLLDVYRLELETKGASTWANWTTVYITTNLSMSEFHGNAKPAHRKALFRRISKWMEFREGEEPFQKLFNYRRMP